jgi:type IV pilus assembly protein PilB
VHYSDEALIDDGVDPEQVRGKTFYEANGCDECNGTGYRGRVAIIELLELNDEIRDLIIAKVPATRLKQAARDAGVMFLRESAVEKFAEGITTLKEINRVTFVE